MDSKVFCLFGVLVVVLLITSEVSARDLAETSTEKNSGEVTKQTDGGEEVNHPDRIRWPRPGTPVAGRGRHRGHEGFVFNCHHGCCKKVLSLCRKCCSYAGEAVETQPETTPLH